MNHQDTNLPHPFDYTPCFLLLQYNIDSDRNNTALIHKTLALQRKTRQSVLALILRNHYFLMKMVTLHNYCYFLLLPITIWLYHHTRYH